MRYIKAILFSNGLKMLAHSLLKVLKKLIGSPKLACVKLFEISIATIDIKKK